MQYIASKSPPHFTLFESASSYTIQVIQYSVAQSETKSSLQWISEHPVTGKKRENDAHITLKTNTYNYRVEPMALFILA